MKSITVEELKKKMENKEEFVLYDVRENYEYEAGNINGINIPVKEFATNYQEIPKDKMVIVHCKSGGRSGQVIEYLNQAHKFDNLYNLEGGLMAYKQRIDPSINVL